MWDFNSTSLLDALLWMLLIFIWIAFIFIWVRCVFDLFADRELGGFAKTIWAICFIFFAPLTTLVYLIARGKSMGERQLKAMADAQAAQEKYIKQVAADSATSPAEQIKHAKELLDSGAISQAEYDQIKAKALA
jgi:Short C-terminal domain